MIVEHRDLLMMAASDGMRAVEPKADRARHFPAQQHRDDARHDELLQSPEITAQDVYIAIGAILREPQHLMADRLAAAVLVGGQRVARVEVPADQTDASLRTLHHPSEQRVILA